MSELDTPTRSLDLTEVQWQVADAIARQLVIEGTDVNELRKALAYLREYVNRENAGPAFFDYLKMLVSKGERIGHSQKTVEYYKSLAAVCEEYLTRYQDDAPVMLMILGWAARLVKYYDKGVPTGEIQPISVISEREAEIQAMTQTHSFQIGQTLDANVKSIKGNKVTYEILGTIKLTVKEPKQAASLAEGQQVVVRVTRLKDNGSLKNVKLSV